MNEDDEILVLREKINNLDKKLTELVYSGKFFVKFDQDELNEIETDFKSKEGEEAKMEKKRKLSIVELKKLDRSIKYNILEWMLVTGWSGPSKMVRAKNKFQKIIWFFIFMVFMGATIYLLIITLEDYLLYNEVTSVTLENGIPAQFPTITICNLNPFYLKSFLSSNNQSFNYTYYSNAYDFNDTEINLNNTSYFLRYQKLFASAKHNEFPKMFETANSLGNEKLLLNFKESVLACVFLGQNCNFQEDFDVYFNMDNFLCFKYNANFSKIKTINKSGLLNGLQFSIFLNDYTSDVFNNKKGLRIYIHNSTEIHPIDFIDIGPGDQANIGIKRSYYKRLSQPYTNCIIDLTSKNAELTDPMKYMFNVLNVSLYTFDLCQAIVFSQYLNQSCNCIDKSFRISDINYLCHTSSQIDCMNFYRSLYSIDISASCPTECDKIDFNKEIFYSEYLTEWYVDYMKNSLKPYLNNLNDSSINPQIKLLNKLYSQNATIESIRQNIVSFNIYFSDLNYNLMNDVPQNNWFVLLANLAGICGGSFLGMSLLSIIEFFEYVLFCIFIFTRSRYKYLKKFIMKMKNDS